MLTRRRAYVVLSILTACGSGARTRSYDGVQRGGTRHIAADDQCAVKVLDEYEVVLVGESEHTRAYMRAPRAGDPLFLKDLVMTLGEPCDGDAKGG